MSLQRRIAIATRGFRGDFGEKYYLNETVDIKIPEVNVSILETVPVTTIEVVSVEVSSLEVEGAY